MVSKFWLALLIARIDSSRAARDQEKTVVAAPHLRAACQSFVFIGRGKSEGTHLSALTSALCPEIRT